MERKFEWIFFDLDGTLVNSMPALYRIYLGFLEKFGRMGNRKEFEELNGPALPEIISILKKRHDLPDSEQFLVELYKKEIARDYQNFIEPIDGAEDVLRELHGNGCRLALVTSAYRDMAAGFIRNKNWDRYFEHCVFGDEVGRAKPGPEIYTLALARTSAPIDSVIAIEDSPNGIRSAKSAGVLAVGIINSYSKEELTAAGAYKIISDLCEVKTILDN